VTVADPPTFQLRYRLLSHAPEEAEVVLAHGLEMAFCRYSHTWQWSLRRRSGGDPAEAEGLDSSTTRLVALGRT